MQLSLEWRGEKKFFSYPVSRLAPGHTLISFQCVSRTHSTKVKLPRHEADHSQGLCINGAETLGFVLRMTVSK
jgi:hypothetical protein